MLFDDRIYGNPKAAILPAVNIVVRLILVPGRMLFRMSFLNEQMIVIKAHYLTSGQKAGNNCQGRCKYKFFVLLNCLPVAKVFHKITRIVFTAGYFGALTRAL